MKNDLGERLKTWRMTYGLAQYKAATLIGITQKTVSLTENGLSYPAPLTAAAIERTIRKPPKKK